MYLDIPLGLRFPPLAILMIRQLDTDIVGLFLSFKNIDGKNSSMPRPVTRDVGHCLPHL